MDPIICNEVFKCSTPISHLKDESNLVYGMSTRNSFGGQDKKWKPKKIRHASVCGEDRILIRKINIRFMNVERDGTEIIKGLDKVKNKVDELLKASGKTVEEFRKNGDNKGQYQTASQKLANMADEMTLLSVGLSQFLTNVDFDNGNMNKSLMQEEGDGKSAKSNERSTEAETCPIKDKETKGQKCRDGVVLDITDKFVDIPDGNLNGGEEKVIVGSILDDDTESTTEKVKMNNNDTTQMNLKQITESSKSHSVSQNEKSIKSSAEDYQLTIVTHEDKSKENPTIISDEDISLQNFHGLHKLDSGYTSTTVTFVEGSPDMFWIHQNTHGLVDLQTYLETRFKDKELAERTSLRIGNPVLVKYFFDGKLYRAKVEDILVVADSEEDCLYSVRFTDYGDLDVVSGADIQCWERELDCIPYQAVSCRLVDGPQHWKDTKWSLDQLGVFNKIIRGNLSVELRKKMTDEQANSNTRNPMFEAYVCREGVSIVDSIRKHPAFQDAFFNGEPPESGNTTPKESNIPPEDEGSPIPSFIITEAKSKVTDWLEKCQDENTPSASPNVSSLKSFRAKLFPRESLQSKDKVSQSSEVETYNVLPVFEADPLRIEEDADGGFLYFLSMVESPGKFFIHPVQKETTFIDQISTELASYSLYAPKEHYVVEETLWALCNQIDNKWYRVRIESRASKMVSVRYIDYGTSHERISVDSLRCLPDSWVTRLPGLAIRCHLAGCSPNRKTWDPKLSALLEKMVGYEKQNRGVVAKLEFGSVGLILITEEDLIINDKIVAL